MRKKLLEHNWLEIERQESNPTQVWRRLKDMAVRAIDDLIILAQKLPEHKQKEIFSPKKIDEFITYILYRGDSYPFPDTFNPRKAELAAKLVERGIRMNSYQYRALNRDTLSLIEPTINHLRQSINICKDISRKVELTQIEEEAERTETAYLFSWNKMLSQEKHRLLDFIIKKTGKDQIEVLYDTVKRTNKKIECKFGEKMGIEGAEDPVYGTFSITMNDTNSNAEASIFDNQSNTLYEEDLLVRKSNEYTNDFFLFIKRKKIRKKMKS